MTSSAQNSKQSLTQQGSATVPAYSFLGDQDTGVYRSAANELSIATNATQRVVVDSSGNVGIGTSSPTYPLDVNGMIASKGGPLATRSSSATSGYVYNIIYDAAGNGAIICGSYIDTTNYYRNAGHIFGSVGGTTEYMRIDNSGNVGIGTSSPDAAYKLDVVGRVRGYYGFTVNGGNTLQLIDSTNSNSWDFANNTNNLTFTYNSTEYMRIDNSGNVGIGTSSPPEKLSVNGNLYFSSSSPIVYGGGNLTLQSGVASYMRFNVAAGAEAMRISSGGAVSIGGTATDGLLNIAGDTFFKKTSSAYNAMIASGSASSSGYLGVYNSSGTRIGFGSHWSGTYYFAAWTDSTTPVVIGTDNLTRLMISGAGDFGIGSAATANYRVVITSAGTGSSTYDLYTQASDGTNNFLVRSDGYCQFSKIPGSWTTGSSANVFMDSGGGLYKSTSSLRYKRDVTDYTRSLADVMKLRPVFYKGKSERDGDTQFAGLIAEEVAAAGLTEFVVYDEDGKPDALHYGNMVALLIKTVQDQQKTIQGLSARIAAVEPA